MNRLLIILALVVVTTTVNAQEGITASKFRPAYFCEFNTGILTFNDFRSFAHVKNGVSLSPRWDLSLGLGLEGHLTGRYIPIFFEGRFNILTGNVRPFISVSAGYLQVVQNWYYYSFSDLNDEHKGFTGGFKVGVQKQFSPTLSFVTALGYRYSATSYVRDYNDWWVGVPTQSETIIHNMNRFELSIGLIFK